MVNLWQMRWETYSFFRFWDKLLFKFFIERQAHESSYLLPLAFFDSRQPNRLITPIFYDFCLFNDLVFLAWAVTHGKLVLHFLSFRLPSFPFNFLFYSFRENQVKHDWLQVLRHIGRRVLRKRAVKRFDRIIQLLAEPLRKQFGLFFQVLECCSLLHILQLELA